MNKNICIDATLFLGLNSENEAERIATKNFFIKHLKDKIYMSYEQVAICDNLIWSYDHIKQSIYYPFMDYFMTEINLLRKLYTELTINKMQKCNSLTFNEQLTCAFVKEHDGTLYTWNSNLVKSKQVTTGDMIEYNHMPELVFPREIESLYQVSLNLRICIAKIYFDAKRG